MQSSLLSIGSVSRPDFVEVEAEAIIKAFARQLKIMREKDISPPIPKYPSDRWVRGSLVAVFQQDQPSPGCTAAGQFIPGKPQTIILVGRTAQLHEPELHMVQGIFLEPGRADRVTDIAKMPDLNPETAVRDVMQQRNFPNLTTIKVRDAMNLYYSKLGGSQPVASGISPLSFEKTLKVIRPSVTLG